jgi:nucleoside-diphosphate-sugar epimerase
MRVVVTGGTGYLGSAIVQALARGGDTPVVFARRASAARLPGEAIDGDVRDRAAVRRAVQGADAVCHAAALVSVWRAQPAEFDDVNVEGLRTVLGVCRELRTPRIVHTSSFLALPPAGRDAPLAGNDYQRTKARAHEVAREAAEAGLPVISLVPGVIYGPGADTEGNLIGRLIRDHLAGTLPGIIGAGREWSYAYIDDVAEAHVRAIVSGRVGQLYPLGGENVPQMRVFEIVRKLTGRRLPRRIPYAVAWAAALFEEARARLTGRAPLLTRGVVSIFRHEWSMDSARSLAELSYRVTPLEEGVRAVLAGHGRGPDFAPRT